MQLGKWGIGYMYDRDFPMVTPIYLFQKYLLSVPQKMNIGKRLVPIILIFKASETDHNHF